MAATGFQMRRSTAYCAVSVARSIVLIGMMGAGKSSVGRALQRRTGLARIDTDELIAAEFGISVTDIFKKHGEEKFRDAEAELLRKLRPERPTIITTGGGVVLRGENINLLKRLGIVVWLAANEAVLFERATRRNTRPLLQNENPFDAFSELLRKRLPLYQIASEFQVDTSTKNHEEAAEEILRRLEEFAPR